MTLNKLLSTLLLFSFIAASFQLKRVLVQNSYPMVICTPGQTGITNFQGIEIQLFNEVYSSFGLNTGDWEYECVDSEATIYSKLIASPSDYVGGFGALKVSLNQQLQGFTYSGPTLHTGLSLIVSSQQNEWIFLKVCTIGSIATILVGGIVMAILQYFFERKEYPFEDYLWNAFSSMFFVTSVRLRTTAARILMIVFWFCILIFTSAYAANLTAVLTIDKSNQEIDKVSDLEQTVIKAPQNYMSALPLYGIRPIKLTGDINITAMLDDLADGAVDGYAFEDSIVQMLERQDCHFAKKVRLFHPFNYVIVFSSDISDTTKDQVNLGMETALESKPSLTRIQSFLEDELGLYLNCSRESPIDADKMSFADILHLGEILGGALGVAIILHIVSKAKFYKAMQQFLVDKHFLNEVDQSKKNQRKVGDELIIDNLKQVTKNSMENLSGGINERLDQMDEKVTKFYEILLNTQANSEMNAYDLSRDLDENKNSRSFSDDSMEKNMDEHPIRDFRSDIPLEDYTPMQSPNQSLLKHDNDGEILERSSYRR